MPRDEPVQLLGDGARAAGVFSGAFSTQKNVRADVPRGPVRGVRGRVEARVVLLAHARLRDALDHHRDTPLALEPQRFFVRLAPRVRGRPVATPRPALAPARLGPIVRGGPARVVRVVVRVIRVPAASIAVRGGGRGGSVVLTLVHLPQHRALGGVARRRRERVPAAAPVGAQVAPEFPQDARLDVAREPQGHGEDLVARDDAAPAGVQHLEHEVGEPRRVGAEAQDFRVRPLLGVLRFRDASRRGRVAGRQVRIRRRAQNAHAHGELLEVDVSVAVDVHQRHEPLLPFALPGQTKHFQKLLRVPVHVGGAARVAADLLVRGRGGKRLLFLLPALPLLVAVARLLVIVAVAVAVVVAVAVAVARAPAAHAPRALPQVRRDPSRRREADGGSAGEVLAPRLFAPPLPAAQVLDGLLQRLLLLDALLVVVLRVLDPQHLDPVVGAVVRVVVTRLRLVPRLHVVEHRLHLLQARVPLHRLLERQRAATPREPLHEPLGARAEAQEQRGEREQRRVELVRRVRVVEEPEQRGVRGRRRRRVLARLPHQVHRRRRRRGVRQVERDIRRCR